jgi:hypothetical protein
MNLTVKIKRFLKRKLATAVLVSASVAAFATLGDGGKKGSTLNTGKATNARSFSVKTNFNYRGNHLFSSSQPKYITLNTTVTYQKGNSTYIVPLKKKVLLDKIKFNPAPNKF